MRHFERYEFDLPPDPKLTEDQIEILARKVHEEDDAEALRLLQSQFFPFLCGIVREVEDELCVGTELVEDELDPTKTKTLQIPPWRHNSEVPTASAALELVLKEFHRELLSRFDPERGPFQPWLFKWGRRNLRAALHYAIAKGNPEVFQWDGRARRARLRRGRVAVFAVPWEEIEEFWPLEAAHGETVDATRDEIGRLLDLLYYSNQRPEAASWNAIASEGEFELIWEYVQCPDAELAAERLWERGRKIKAETVRRTSRRVLARAKKELAFLLKENCEIEGEGIYALPAGERVRMKRRLRQWLDGQDSSSE